MNNRKYYILNYIFILGVILLFLNDHIFKYEYSNWITGKLSDVVGLLVFPFFLTFLFPKSIKWNVIITGLFFVFWKSPYSQQFIDLYNSVTFIQIVRVVDYSDLMALLVLPLSYSLLKNINLLKRFCFNKRFMHPIVILLPSILIFMASSPPAKYRIGAFFSDGSYRGYLSFSKNKVNIRKSQNEILNELKKMEIHAVIDTAMNKNSLVKYKFYIIKELILEKDTIKDLRFYMETLKENKTKVSLIAITISEEINSYNMIEELRKYYKKLLSKYLKSRLK